MTLNRYNALLTSEFFGVVRFHTGPLALCRVRTAETSAKAPQKLPNDVLASPAS